MDCQRDNISIIIPCYNEAIVIKDTLLHAMNCSKRNDEIIVVDDESQDDTFKVVYQLFAFHKIKVDSKTRIKTKRIKSRWVSFPEGRIVSLIQKCNGGKADSLNVGIREARYDYLLCVDADTIINKNTIDVLYDRLILKEAAGVGGRVIPIIDKSTNKLCYSLSALQLFEYDISFSLSRRIFNLLDANLLISGALGLFDKKKLIKARGYSTNTLGEDLDLIFRFYDHAALKHQKIDISYSHDAISYTQGPVDLANLFKQRSRWQQGLFEVIKTHFKTVFASAYPKRIRCAFIYYALIELPRSYYELVGFLILISLFVCQKVSAFFLFFYLVIFTYLPLFAFTKNAKKIVAQNEKCIFGKIKLYLTLLVLTPFYHYFISFARMSMPVYALYKKIRHKNMWGIQKREKMKRD